MYYNPFLVYCRELAPGTVSLTDDRAQGDDSKHDSHYTADRGSLPLNAPLATKVVCFSRLVICSGSKLFASILNLSVMLGNYLQQTTSGDDIFR